MKYLLDTCVISDFVKGDTNTLSHVKSVSPSQMCVSTITIMEIQYGLCLNPSRAGKIKPLIDSFLKVIHILEFDRNDAIQASNLRASLKKQGSPIGSYDILLAGTAFQRNLILVSANVKEFSRINGLSLENWRN